MAESINQRIHERSGTGSEATALSNSMWRAIVNLPIIREWRAARDTAFLLTSFPVGLTYFLIAVTGLAVGVPLTILVVGFFVLGIMLASWALLTRIERARLNTFLNAGIPEYRRIITTEGGVMHRLRMHLTDPAMTKELLYGVLMFPIGILELSLVFLPLSHMFAPAGQLFFGSVQPGIGTWVVDSPFEALMSFFLGLLLIVPVVLFSMVVASWHKALARKLLG